MAVSMVYNVLLRLCPRLEVNYDPRESGPHWACLCTTTCIPPDVDSFYFEVHLVELAEDQ